MAILLISWIASLLILVPILLGGAFSGLRKGAYHAGVKLAALILSIALSVIITLLLRGVLTNLLSGILLNILPASLHEQASILQLISQIVVAVLLLIVFWLIFTVVRLLMLIPQKIICRMLPKKLEDCKTYQKVEETAPAALTDSPSAENAVATPTAEEAPVTDASMDDTTSEAPVPAVETAPVIASQNHTLHMVLWRGGAALCGALSSLLFLSVLLMPIAGIVTRGGNAVYRVSNVLNEEGYGEYAEEISDIAHAISTSPLFAVPDFLVGKTVFEPLTSISTESGKVNLSKELNAATDVLCQALPAAIHVTQNGTLSKEDAELLAGAVEPITESNFMLSVGTWAASYAGEQLTAGKNPDAVDGKQAFTRELGEMMSDMTPEYLANDLETLAELTEVLAESPILKVFANSENQASPSDLIDRQTMRGTFGILYDNEHTQPLLVPLANLGTEIVFQSMGAEPVYSNTDISTLSRDQVMEEADRLCAVAENMSSFTQSMEGTDTSIADYEMVAAGKALDILRESALFGNQYETMVKSVTSASGNNQNSALMESLGDALVESESAEKLMNSAQNMINMSDALEDTTAKGRENKKLVSSLDVLLNDTTPKDANSLSGIAGEHFLSDRDNLDSETKKQMLEDSMKALVTVCATGSDDVEAEADAIQTFNDLSNAKTTNVFEGIGEKKAVDDFLASELAMEMLKNLNAENRDYDIRAKLTDDNKANISAALAESTADAARKQVVGQFFGVN